MKKYQSYEFKIFDRWGEIIFRTNKEIPGEFLGIGENTYIRKICLDDYYYRQLR